MPLTERGEGSSLYEQHCGSEKSLVQGVKEVPYEVQVLQYTNTTQCLLPLHFLMWVDQIL